MKPALATFGERLRYARELAGLSQRDLAKLVSLAPTTIASIETRESVRSTRTLEIAEALGVRPEWLERGREPMIRVLPPSEETIDLARQIEKLPPQGRAAIRALILAYGPAVADERVAEFIKPIKSRR